MNTMRRLFTLLYAITIFATMLAQSKSEAYLAYIDQYRDMAIEQQRLHQIPAYITIAQGLLESAAGQSELAQKANNHFGIKCSSNWSGKGIQYKGDCYRKYASVRDSYEDHSQFLLRKRYESLFELSITDYKGWARGLKACGYAEDPKYPEKLISLIEQYDLQDLTKVRGTDIKAKRPENKEIDAIYATEIYEQAHRDLQAYVMPPIEDFHILANHASGYRNGVKYVIAKQGDTFYSLAKELDIHEKALRKFNDAQYKQELEAGDMVYVYAKRNKSGRKYTYYYSKPGDDLWEIAQKYGIKLKKLCQRNHIRYSSTTTPPEKLQLR